MCGLFPPAVCGLESFFGPHLCGDLPPIATENVNRSAQKQCVCILVCMWVMCVGG